MNNHPFSIILPSCDAYRDSWKYFFYFLFKYWQEPPPVYLISNYSTYADERVITLPIGKDVSWSDNTRSALQKIESPILLFLLDDFFLDQPVNNFYLNNLANTFRKFNGDYLALDQGYSIGEKLPSHYPLEGNISLRQMTTPREGVGLNVSFWKKSFFEKVCEPSMNIWQTENHLKSLVKEPSSNICLLDTAAPLPIHYVESIKGRFWKDCGIEYLQKNNLPVDLKFRPQTIHGNTFSDNLKRSFYKRIIESRNYLDSTLKTSYTIKPL